MVLYHYQTAERFFSAPVDLEMVKAQLSAAQDTSSGSASQSQSYTDFLLPLPEHLQPTEIGLPDPNVIKERRKEGGLDRQIAQRDPAKELKARNELKNQAKLTPTSPKPSPGPTMSRKRKIVPRPGGGTMTYEDES
jgi:hypothetical protein